MRYLLDTNICIFAMKRHLPVLRQMRAAGQERLSLSTVVVAELAFGVARSDTAHREKNDAALRRFLSSFQVLDWTSDAAWKYGAERQRLREAGTPIGELDLMIAAHALSENMVVVTNNRREFERVNGLRIEDWTEEAQ